MFWDNIFYLTHQILKNKKLLIVVVFFKKKICFRKKKKKHFPPFTQAHVYKIYKYVIIWFQLVFMLLNFGCTQTNT